MSGVGHSERTEHHICHGELTVDHSLWPVTAYQTYAVSYTPNRAPETGNNRVSPGED